MFSEKQKEYFMCASHRWNIKVGATRSGKSYCDYFTIPMRIRRCRGDGLIVLIGNTVTTLKRNILDPMRSIWGDELVGYPSSGNNTVVLFGRECYMIGAGLSSAASRLQGSGIEYCYGDEITTWSEDVFAMLKSRLDKPYSCFDGTCNPENPSHWFKRFLDSDADIYVQHYTIDDNPFLTEEFVSRLKAEYFGTVYYDRYVRGLWTVAEGAIYRAFAASPENYTIAFEDIRARRLRQVTIGVDFGGTRSATSFVATATSHGSSDVIVLASERHAIELDAERLCNRFCDFVCRILSLYGRADVAYCDSAESVLIRTLRAAVRERGLPIAVRNAAKTSVNDRIRLTLGLMNQGRLRLSPDARSLADAFCTAVWDPDVPGDVRLDNGTSDIDSLDAFEYTIEREVNRLIRRYGGI